MSRQDRDRSGLSDHSVLVFGRSPAMLKTAILAAATTMITLTAPASAEQSSRRGSGSDEWVMELPLEKGLTQRILYLAPSRPRATLIMLPGGSGKVDVQRDGDLRHDDNFVVRTREDWVARGYAVLIPDTIAEANLRGARSSPAYGKLVEDLVAYAHSHVQAPVFLIGTSQGTIAAMNGAARARPDAISGIVLTESVSIPGRLSAETVFDADPSAVRVPALVVANRDDACDVAPPEMAPRIVAAMTHSPDARVITVEGGVKRSAKACGSLSPHGYYDIESEVIGAIASWLREHGG
ncbi:MAG: alpha/beta hydrolase [Acetobacter sp.]|nr:lysophospholipase [Acetobacter sp.]MCH4060726.1 lysophospholipase [Acetobacter sp.]MCH4087666.1 lysophospholipase [Acetobacter sp.]MCI1294411.1 alpha/beta hydrolase [Acetobacter sp.]MCI1321061.1 alpha/beta hydrolase [Acetobacter sp.]